MKTPIQIDIGYGNVYAAGPISSEFHRILVDEMTSSASQYVSTDLDRGFMSNVPLGEVIREHRSHNHYMLVRRDNVVTFLEHVPGSGVQIYTAGERPDEAEAECSRVAGLIPRKELNDDVVSSSIWSMSSNGPTSTLRDITAQPWTDVERNYASAVARSLSELMKSTAPTTEHAGRIVLWYGPPGTGKTTALRALAREWRPWCDLHVVSDPEVLMKSPDYLFKVTDAKGKWRLIVAEDSDAFTHSGSGGSAAMGRLLNFTDGLLGQGSKTLFLLTTNEPVAKLHPAVTRPGRCMAQIEFSPFSAVEAAEWLGRDYKAPSTARTLAELYEDLRDGGKKITRETEYAPVGQYL